MELPVDDVPFVGAGLLTVRWHRATEAPFNALALLIFACAVVHTLLAGRIRRWSEARWDHRSGRGRLWHFLSEIEVVFGLWVVVLAVAMALATGWPAVTEYLGTGVNYTEPLFVVVIMAMAASRPVLDLAERVLQTIAGAGGETPAAWWVTLLAVAPLLGSLITEPAAMTIAASLLSKRIFALRLSEPLRYATPGVLFVNISVGGTLTHFRSTAGPDGRTRVGLGPGFHADPIRLARGSGMKGAPQAAHEGKRVAFLWRRICAASDARVTAGIHPSFGKRRREICHGFASERVLGLF